MKFFVFAFLTTALFATEKLRIYDDLQSETPLYASSNYEEIASALHTIGVRFEQWEASKQISETADQQEVFDAYRIDIDKLVRENNYKTVDIVKMMPNSPKKIELRKKFLNEHTHTEDEVRFFVEGSGLFYLHVDQKVFIVLCERGDLISIPANYTHWFDMGESPYFTAIRFFDDPSGWVANFTESQIADHFPRFE